MIDAQPGSETSFRLADTHPFNHWTVTYRASIDDPAIELDSGGVTYDPDVASATLGPLSSTFTFEGPPSGDWVVSVALQFAGRGDGIYYWHFAVP